MLNMSLGVPRTVAGVECIATRAGAAGHAVFGPYEQRGPGVYRVEFSLALDQRAPPPGDPVCATLDVTARGDIVLATAEIAAGALSPEFAVFAVSVSLVELRTLEYRVHVSGDARLLVGAVPRVTRTGDVKDAAGPPRMMGTGDPFALHRQVRSVLRLLRPHAVRGHSKARFGAANDGGYVQIDDFEGIDTAFSFGISDDISWDLDVAARGLTIHQFDHTVEDPAPDDPRMIFAKTMIAPEAGPGAESIAALVARHDKRGARPNLMLKMDIECAEWAVVQQTPAETLARFSQIVCELHAFQNLYDPAWRQGVFDALDKIGRHYGVVHVHANVYGGITNIANVIVPNVLEVTFANRTIYALEDTDELFPGPLDASCSPEEPDLLLGSFRF